MTRPTLLRICVLVGAAVVAYAALTVPALVLGRTFKAGIMSGMLLMYENSVSSWLLARIR